MIRRHEHESLNQSLLFGSFSSREEKERMSRCAYGLVPELYLGAHAPEKLSFVLANALVPELHSGTHLPEKLSFVFASSLDSRE
jgi:hypothetical protein